MTIFFQMPPIIFHLNFVAFPATLPQPFQVLSEPDDNRKGTTNFDLVSELTKVIGCGFLSRWFLIFGFP